MNVNKLRPRDKAVSLIQSQAWKGLQFLVKKHLDSVYSDMANLAVNPLTPEGQARILRNQGQVSALLQFFEEEKLINALAAIIEESNRVDGTFK